MNTGFEILPEIWSDHEKLEETHIYLENIYNRLIRKIGLKLNSIHGTDFPCSFWELPLSSWLLHYMHTSYDRYCRLECAAKLYGKENITVLYQKYETGSTINYADFITKYSLIETSCSAFYGLIAQKAGFSVLEFDADVASKPLINLSLNKLSKADLKRKISRLIEELSVPIPFGFFKGKDILIHPYRFNKREKFTFVTKLKASIFPRIMKSKPTLNKVNRSALSSIQGDDEFENIAIDLLPVFLPEYLLEEFSFYKQKAKKWSNYKVYFAGNHWHGDILLCYSAAFGKLNGAKIIGCQHGGGYGQYKNSHVEKIERKICDYFITWGWNDSRYPGAKLLSLPQPGLSRYFNRHKTTLPMVLWVSHLRPKNLFRFQPSFHMPHSIFQYYKYSQKFAANLEARVRKYIVYPGYYYDEEWLKERKNLFRLYPEIRVTYIGSFVTILHKVKLFIADYQSTSFMESLVTNTPTILFWKFNQDNERSGARPLFDYLREAGILFHNPEDAAKQVNAIWDDVQGWWLHKDRQQARIKFMESHCRADPDWQTHWINAFKDIIHEKQ